jgi:hypothetical protein
LRSKLAAWVPTAEVGVPEAVKTMRLITRKSQKEYAQWCGVSPRVLADHFRQHPVRLVRRVTLMLQHVTCYGM